MSDETRKEPAFMEDAEGEAPTERDPAVHPRFPTFPARGVALSTLYWLDSAAEDLGD